MHLLRNIRILAIMLLTAAAFSLNAGIPTGYYNSAYNLKTSDLKTAISKIVNPHQQVSSYNNLPNYFRQTDVRPGTQLWWDMYSNLDVNINVQFGTYMNREHSLPKSWWGGTTTIPAYVDLNHLYPGEAKANQAKSNYPLGEVVGTTTFTNGVSTVGVGANSGGAKYVFEPADEYKGDFARTYFYMVTCYQDLNWTTTWQVRNGTYPSLQQWAIDLLLKWHRADPVSEKEQLRNEAVYSIQNNRNPFIDYPELAEHIWGNKMDEAWMPGSTPVEPEESPSFSAPINGMTIDFGQVALGNTATQQFLIKGQNLTSANVNMLIAQYDCKQFSVPGTAQLSNGATRLTLSPVAAGSESGTWVTINYTPDALGEHTATAQVSGAGYVGTIKLSLRGECLPVPTLSQPLNPAAIDITDNSYTATWDAPTGDEVVDYYVVTRRIYRDGNVTVKEEIAESNELPIMDFDESDYESFTVHSVRLGCTSPESESIVVRHAGIESIDADAPMVIESYPGLLRMRCSTPQSGMTVYDITGRVVLSVNEPITDLYEFTLPAGVYLIVTPEHRRPVKTVAR